MAVVEETLPAEEHDDCQNSVDGGKCGTQEAQETGANWRLNEELDTAEARVNENPSAALPTFKSILASEPRNFRALRGKASALDKMAELQRSNSLLEESIEAYKQVLSLGRDIGDQQFAELAQHCIERMRFKGSQMKAVDVHKMLIDRFPDEPKYSNQLAVTYLMVNRINEAKSLLEEILKRWPKDGFALVHYGFILKTSDNKNLETAVDYLTKGIATRDEGTLDGRFFFQLSDALLKLGRKEEASIINRLGVNEGLFLSEFQRSLYNVDRLKSQPWWTLEETTYAPYLRQLEANWKVIRDEGLTALADKKNKLFRDETENLKDKGNWQQLELFARGRRLAENCARAPRTCQIISEFPAAKDCRRGQAKFSVMDAGTHVFPHCGPTNCRLRTHLGLTVPPGTAIRVATETRSWQEGKVIVFDDSFEHEVWHNGSSFRLVLIVDVWHPELSKEEKNMLPSI